MNKQLTPQHEKPHHAPAKPEHNPHNDFRSLVNHFFNMVDFPPHHAMHELEPKIEVKENKKEVTVSAEVPGIAPENLDVEISSDGYLTLSGEKRQENAEASRDSYFSEITYGSFKRTIPLPWDLDFEKADADYDNGMLLISIPKSPTEQTKKKKLSVTKGRKKKEQD